MYTNMYISWRFNGKPHIIPEHFKEDNVNEWQLTFGIPTVMTRFRIFPVLYHCTVPFNNWENGHMFFKADTFLGINWIKLTADNGK